MVKCLDKQTTNNTKPNGATCVFGCLQFQSLYSKYFTFTTLIDFHKWVVTDMKSNQ